MSAKIFSFLVKRDNAKQELKIQLDILNDIIIFRDEELGDLPEDLSISPLGLKLKEFAKTHKKYFTKISIENDIKNNKKPKIFKLIIKTKKETQTYEILEYNKIA